MKIRIQGTENECASFAADLKRLYNVRSISTFYPNRGNKTAFTTEGRVYCELEPAVFEYNDQESEHDV